MNQASVEAFLLGANHELGASSSGGSTRPTRRAPGCAPSGTPAATAHATSRRSPTGRPTRSAPIPAATNPDQVLVLVDQGRPAAPLPGHAGHGGSRPSGRGRGCARRTTAATPLDPIFSGSLGPDARFLGFEFDAGVDIDVDVPGSTDPLDALPGLVLRIRGAAHRAGVRP